ncbi:MAG TPA: ParB/RepB/Spo0J family partition protein [Candidatus Binataceae bacterium]|nr:ParB/RepB/Spo0J family partition protein [Candidatus Binataceae bacterium]
MIRKPLGRGLDALIDRSGREADGAPVFLMVEPDRIVASPFQPRRHFDVDKLQELTNAIRAQGIIEPLIVRPLASDLDAQRYELIAGERRLRAARAAGLATVPVVVREVDDHAALEMSLVENLVREDLNAIEEARAFVRLSREFNLSHEEIAGRIGKSRPYVTNTMRLLELPIPVVEMIARGELAPGQARPLLGMGSADEQMSAAARIAEGKVTARAAEQMAVDNRPVSRKVVTRVVEERDERPDANLGALAESIQKALKRKVRLTPRHGKLPGKVELEYYDDEDLTALSRMLIAATATT